MWPIAKQTLKAAIRYRFVVAMAVALLVIVFGIPLLVKSDGTAKGTVQIVLTYTLGSTTALLGIASLWMGCGTLDRFGRLDRIFTLDCRFRWIRLFLASGKSSN